MTAANILVQLVRGEVCGVQPEPALKQNLTPELLEGLYRFSKQQDLAHLAGQGLQRLGALGRDEISAKFHKQTVSAVYRHARMEREFDRICSVLTDARIPHIPLKGAVLRSSYPEAWMRTSCDIDVLVKEEQLSAAAKALTEKLGYTREGSDAHEISLFSANGIHLELHHNLIEDNWPGDCEAILGSVWEAAAAMPGGFTLVMPDALFYFYHIAHMAKHFVLGGCGIRPFLDIWVLNHRVSHDRSARVALLQKGQLMEFALAAEKLAAHWFADAPGDEVTNRMTEYLFRGGLYGGSENIVSLRHAEKGSGLRYAFSRIFLPLDQLQMEYPVLVKKKWLYPFCQVARWFRLLFGGKAGYWLGRLKSHASASTEYVDSNAQLLQDLGL